MDILTNTISLLFRPRQKEIAKFAQETDVIQQEQLQSLIHTDQNTEWGQKYNYKTIKSGFEDAMENQTALNNILINLCCLAQHLKFYFFAKLS